VLDVGTPLAGQTDDLTRLHEICRLHDVWLHLDGYDAACLSRTYLSSPLELLRHFYCKLSVHRIILDVCNIIATVIII